MAERSWTPKQRQAIETRDRTLLVSAAAGSGKTATLTERIIRSLMDEEDPVTVDSLLVVTFTNAAAAELRLKIAAALEDAVAKNPENKLLERQLFMLPQAKIRTIDSFCGDILRSNADRVGVPFNYRIADTAECDLIAESILEGLCEAIYSGDAPEVSSPEELDELSDCLTDSKRAEEFSEILRYIYEKCESCEDGVESLRRAAEIYDPSGFVSVEATLHGSYLSERLTEMAEHYATDMARYTSAFPDAPKYTALVYSDLDAVRSLLHSKGYNVQRTAIGNIRLETRPRVKEKTPEMDEYAAVRDSFKEDLKEFAGFFAYTEEMWRDLYSGLYKRITVLYRVIKKFDELFVREKLRRGALSYADVERFAHACLVKDGERTDIAENLAASISAIYIDEYQDVNGLQNSIFEAISRPDNRFMVGDIKQSIYGFRSARPEIFAKMKRDFSPLDSAKDKEPSTVFMSNNFRCDEGVVDFVNSIFDKAFSLLGDSIGYTDEDSLVYSKPSESAEYRAPEVCIIEKPTDENSPTAPSAVASKIEELLRSGRLNNGAPVKPSDIAIIMRNASGKDHLYAEALSSRGIPSRIAASKSFFLCAEVLLALCLLNSIDNPRRDVYLAGLMCSPLYSFTPDELLLIKSQARKKPLYDALKEYCDKRPDFEKGRAFLRSLVGYRTVSEGLSAAELIFRLYHETGLLALAAKSGGKDNLMLLYDYARAFEAGEFKGLYSFIHFINSLIDRRTTFDDNRDAGGEEAVKIVTCHSSKGLEYPVVFLVDAGAKMRNKDAAKPIAYSDDMSIAMRLRSPSGLAVVNNPVVDLINHYNFRKSFEEELRVLYVALTRAREQLYVVGASPLDDTDKYLAKIAARRAHLTPYAVRSLGSYLDIILATSDTPPVMGKSFVSQADDGEAEVEKCAEAAEEAEDDKLADTLYKRFGFKYPHAYLTELPEKMSVSKTSPTVLDGADEGVAEIIRSADEGTKVALPSFMSGSAAEESAKRGIATHYFMQFCSLENLEKNGAAAELERLVREGYISETDGKRVRLDELCAFVGSSLFTDMRAALALHRELRFNVRLPAELFTEEEERRAAYEGRSVLIQGVIDCIIEYPDGEIGLFDYKTDRLTRQELTDRSLAERTLTEKHKTQLSYYALAAERIFGKYPKKVGVYSLHLGDTVTVDTAATWKERIKK
jgi:ATP-dependent helicase/nuclease subunit A